MLKLPVHTRNGAHRGAQRIMRPVATCAGQLSAHQPKAPACADAQENSIRAKAGRRGALLLAHEGEAHARERKSHENTTHAQKLLRLLLLRSSGARRRRVCKLSPRRSHHVSRAGVFRLASRGGKLKFPHEKSSCFPQELCC